MLKRNRVVVTGMGVLAANGIGLDAFWESLLAGRSGIGPITLFDASKFKGRVAGEVKNFDPNEYIEPKLKPRRMARHTQLSYAAALFALKDAGLDSPTVTLPTPTPVIIGVSTSALDVIEKVFHQVNGPGPDRVSPSALSASKPQAPANLIADRLGRYANAVTVSSACPSGLDAIALAAGMIRNGEAELAIAGGADAPITPLAAASFLASGLTSHSNGSPATASRPFDLERQSGVLAEGAGVMILENLESAEARAAKTYMEILGFSAQRDLNPEEPGSGLIDSMKLALANAGCQPSDIDWICAYGPGDPYLDAAEVRFIKCVFGQKADSMPITSIKAVTGNPLAAGGPFQLISCAMSLRDQLLAPTANYQTKDPACDIDVVPNRPRKARLNRALINVRGLGGSASSMVVGLTRARVDT